MGIIFSGINNYLICAKRGSPLAIGRGKNCNYIGSDSIALAPLTQKLCYLNEGDIINIDVTALVDGWHGDTSRMFFVGDVSTKCKNLVSVTYESMMKAINILKPGIKLGDIGNEIQSYQADVNKEVQDFVNTLQKESQEYQNKISLYGTEVQSFQSNIASKTQKSTTATQNAAYYSTEAKKYYEWANMEISSYIQNNSKMINKTIAAQAAQQRR